jgi:hypothetical protein
MATAQENDIPISETIRDSRPRAQGHVFKSQGRIRRFAPPYGYGGNLVRFCLSDFLKTGKYRLSGTSLERIKNTLLLLLINSTDQPIVDPLY